MRKVGAEMRAVGMDSSLPEGIPNPTPGNGTNCRYLQDEPDAFQPDDIEPDAVDGASGMRRYYKSRGSRPRPTAKSSPKEGTW